MLIHYTAYTGSSNIRLSALEGIVDYVPVHIDRLGLRTYFLQLTIL